MGQFGTAADVSAVSTGSLVMQTVTVVITILAMGLTVLVGRKICKGFKEEAVKIIGSGIRLFAILAVAMSVVMVFAAPALAKMIRTTAIPRCSILRMRLLPSPLSPQPLRL